jgi:hypothetical protein
LPVTSLWRVTENISAVVDYTTNEKKTEYTVVDAMENPNGEFAVDDLHDVTDYAMRGNATLWQDDSGGVHRLVSGVNCDPDLVVEQMQATKKLFGKTDGTLAYHGYQSFSEGEGPPDLIHQIGVETARRIWGDKYQVLVTTHVDHADHLHNHFVVNTVSFVDGIKFYRSAADYRKLREVSDQLAEQYGFYVIGNSSKGKVRDYTPNKTSWRKIIKADVDDAIDEALTEKHFYTILQQKGYELKTGGKDISVRASGAKRFIRLERNFGSEYSRRGIREQIVEKWKTKEKPKEQPLIYFRGSFSQQKQKKPCRGFQALYIRYCYLLGAAPKRRQRSSTWVSPALKQDLLKLDRITEQTQMLCRNHIRTEADLIAHRDELKEKLFSAGVERAKLQRQQRTKAMQENPEQFQLNAERLKEIGLSMYALRKELRLCDEVQERSREVAHKVQQVRQQKEYQQQAERQSSRSAFSFGLDF